MGSKNNERLSPKLSISLEHYPITLNRRLQESPTCEIFHPTNNPSIFKNNTMHYDITNRNETYQKYCDSDVPSFYP